MREDSKPKPIEYPPLTPEQQAQLDREQAAGRAAVARAQAELDANRERLQQQELEAKKHEGTMTPVHHPNPSQTEMFPASGATLGKKK
jgi:hypothetical protein